MLQPHSVTNWVKELSEYQSLLNDEMKQELGGKVPLKYTLIENQITW